MTMKQSVVRVLSVLAFAVLALLCVSCNSDDGETGSDGDSESATEDSEAELDATEEEPDGDIENSDSESAEEIDGDSTESDLEVEDEIPAEILPFEPASATASPDPMTFGPFPVGVKTVMLHRPVEEDGQTVDRPLKTEIWYPAVQSALDMPKYVLDFKEEAADIDLGDKEDIIMNADIPNIETDSYRDAEMDRSHGPYPLVAFSHGANGIRWQSVFWTIHLASHGYIVVSCDHWGNTLWDIIVNGYQADSIATSFMKRPDDVIFLIDTMLGYNADEESFYYKSIDEALIGVTGHSLGGMTSVAVPCLDNRVSAAVLHSPVIGIAMMVSGCDSDNYPIPTITMGGTMDNTLAWCGQYCDYKNKILGDQTKYLYELVGGGHFTFSDICRLDLISVSQELGMGDDATNALSDGCGEENVPYLKAQQSINYYGTAYFNYLLRGSIQSLDYMVDKNEDPFDVVNFYEGDVPDWPEEGGCNACKGIGK